MVAEPTKQIDCEKCGKKTPVTVISVKGEVTLAIWCRHCKHLTIVKMKDVEE